METRQRENNQIKDEVANLRSKLNERERVYQQNKDLVTKNCGQASQIDRLRKENEELKRNMEQIKNDQRAQEMQKQDVGPPRVYRDHLQKQRAKSPV